MQRIVNPQSLLSFFSRAYSPHHPALANTLFARKASKSSQSLRTDTEFAFLKANARSYMSSCMAAVIPCPAQADQSVYTPTHGEPCADRSRAQFNAWRCPGPAGYVADYLDEGNVAGVAIWSPVGKWQAPSTVSWRGSGKVFGDRLEWRVEAGVPKSAILRIWRVGAAADGSEHQVEELVLLKVLPTGSCRVASTNARQAGAYEMVQKLSEQVRFLACAQEQ